MARPGDLLLALGGALAMLLAGCRGDAPAAAPAIPRTMQLESAAFTPGGAIPAAFACDGEDRSPPLAWAGAPAETAALAVIVDDPDAGGFVHWALFDLPPGTAGLEAGLSPGGALPAGAKEGRNDFGRDGYGGPCPPRGATHRYRFRVIALDAPLGLAPGARGREVRKAAEAHALAEGQLEAVYRRP